MSMKHTSFTKSTLAVAVMAVSAGLPNVTWAQDDTIEEIVVSGFRTSLVNSLNIKKNKVGMVDSITAEDIGDFPDNNLAESMGRISGVVITRANGQGANISVRGLSSDFSRTRINGMESQATTYNNTSRTFDFNLFASELFSRLDVTKTSEAKLEEGSLGATVDVYTARPFDYKGDKIVMGVKVGRNDNAGEIDPRMTGLVSMQNEEGTFGGALSVAYSNFHTATNSGNSGRWESNTGIGNNRWANSASLSDELNNAFHPRFPRYYNDETEFTNLGITGSLQWRPVDSTLLTFDALNSSQDQDALSPALTPISMSRTGSTGRVETSLNSDPATYTYDSGKNALLRASLTGVDIRSEGVERHIEDEFAQYSLTLDQDILDSLKMKVLVGHAESESKGIQTLAILEAFNKGLSYDYTKSQSEPALAYDFDLKDPASWVVSESRFNNKTTTLTFDNGVVDFDWEINDTFSVSVGASRKVFEFDYFDLNKNVDFRGNPQQTTLSSTAVNNCAHLTLAGLNSVDQSLGGLYSDWAGQDYFLADWDAFADKIGYPDSNTDTTDACFALAHGGSGRRNVEETDTGAYGQLNMRTDIGSMEFAGNIGVRKADTDVKSTGDIAGVATTVNKSYSDTLPSINAGLWITEEFIVRASWAEVMTRPSIGNLTPGGTVDGFNRRYTAGNPGLDPFRAKATDLSAEWYFADESLLSLAYFEKDIEAFPASINVSVPWPELGLPNSLLDSTPATPSDIFEFKSLQNGLGGKLDGWELQYQAPFQFGPQWLRNSGVILNYTSINSKLNYGTEAVPTYGRLKDQTDETYNLTLWYENDAGFDARISYSHTGDSPTLAISRFNVTSGPRAGILHGEDLRAPTDYVDAKIGYKLNESLSFSFEMLNLTDESSVTVMGSDGYNLEDTSNTSGRQFYLGMQYSFL